MTGIAPAAVDLQESGPVLLSLHEIDPVDSTGQRAFFEQDCRALAV
jgi:hypothetical protein